jgi:hypothetical protein
MTTKQLAAVDGDLAKEARDLYYDAFRELNAFAANRHLMTDEEFYAVMADERITKFLILDDGGSLAGLITWTNHLEAVPLIAPEYYRRRWPEHVEQGRYFYIPFFATGPAARHSGAFVEGFAELFRIAEPVDGLVGLDICVFNEQQHRLPQTILVLLKRMSGGRSLSERSDEQSFWTFDLTGNTLKEKVTA